MLPASMDFPEPASAAFRERCLRLVQEADDFCRDEAGLPRRDILARPCEPEPLPPVLRSLPLPKPEPGCVGCGCPRSDVTLDCPTCRSRYLMRIKVLVQEDSVLRARINRIGVLIEEAFDGPKPVRKRPKLTRGCVGCGCPLDERTRDCFNCTSRHYMRGVYKINRLCRMIEAAYP